MSGGTVDTKAEVDPMLSRAALEAFAERYLGDAARDDPRVSPLFADLSGLPPLLIQVGTDEVLLDDSLRLRDQARDAGVDVVLEEYAEMTHVFQFIARLLPEARRAIQSIGAFVRARTASA